MSARCPVLLACVLLLPWSAFGAGQPIYKSVDAQGNVTYSSAPPVGGATAQPVNIPGTTKPQNPAAEQQHRQAEQAFALRQKARKEQKEQQTRALNEAEDRRDRAKRDLETAAQPKDQVTRSSERSHGTEGQTAAQTTKEQRALRDAERAVRDAKRGKPPPKQAK